MPTYSTGTTLAETRLAVKRKLQVPSRACRFVSGSNMLWHKRGMPGMCQMLLLTRRNPGSRRTPVFRSQGRKRKLSAGKRTCWHTSKSAWRSGLYYILWLPHSRRINDFHLIHQNEGHRMKDLFFRIGRAENGARVPKFQESGSLHRARGRWSHRWSTASFRRED